MDEPESQKPIPEPADTPPVEPPAPVPLDTYETVAGMRESTPLSDVVTRGSTGDSEVDSVGKLTFLKAYWKQVRAAHANGLSQGMVDPVIWLVDCEDDVGGRIARTWVGGDSLEKQIAARKRGERPGHTTVIVRPIPYDETEFMLRYDFPYLAEVVPERPSKQEICVFVVSLGGAASLFMPIEKQTPSSGAPGDAAPRE
jgi:hypothetical protein